MTTVVALKMLLDLAQHRSDAAAAKLSGLNSQEQEAEQKLRLLLGYRRDYQVRFQEFAKNGIDQVEWQNFRAFMAKLDAAITEQRKAAASSHTSLQAGMTDWHAQQRKLKSYDTLSQRHERAESLRAVKQEQREQDEQASKSFVHSPSLMTGSW
jgi:flagellar FliJ protein